MTKLNRRQQEAMMMREALEIVAERYPDDSEVQDHVDRIINLSEILDFEMNELNKRLKTLDKKYDEFCKKRMN